MSLLASMGLSVALAVTLALLSLAVAWGQYNLWRQRGIAKAFGVKSRRPTFRQYVRVHAKRQGLAFGLIAGSLAFLGLPVIIGASQYKAAQTANDVYVGGLPREWVTVQMTVRTATSLRAGRAVKKDTNDDELQKAAAADKNVLGWLGTTNYSDPDWDPTTAPAANDLVDVHLQVPGAIYKVRNGANLAQGDQAQWGATGLAALASAAAGDTAKRVVRVLESKDGSTTENDICAAVI